jgi:hypothetical protein
MIESQKRYEEEVQKKVNRLEEIIDKKIAELTELRAKARNLLLFRIGQVEGSSKSEGYRLQKIIKHHKDINSFLQHNSIFLAGCRYMLPKESTK